jgi:hypothetical protein
VFCVVLLLFLLKFSDTCWHFTIFDFDCGKQSLYAQEVETVECELPRLDPDAVVTPTDVTMRTVANNPYNVQIFWEHDKNAKGVADEFVIDWSTSREFKTNVGTQSIKDGMARNSTITLKWENRPLVELHLVEEQVYIRMKAVKEIKSIPTQSTPTLATIPWILAIECNDDEYLNNTLTTPQLWSCGDCPNGAYCRGSTAWSDVRPLQGYWRVPWNMEQFERCPFVGDCSGVDPNDPKRRQYGANGSETNASATDGCIVGTESILCSRCSEGYNRDANICTKCENGSIGIRVGILIAVSLVLLAAFLFIRKKLQRAWRKYRSVYRDVLRIFSIVVTFSQINTSMPSIIEVKWPQMFVDFVSNFNVVNIDLFSVIGVSCVGNFNFYLGFCAMLSLPVGIVFYVVVSLWCHIKSMKARYVKELSYVFGCTFF